ncbi:MAG TPA: hypothetical protein VFO60_07150 [Candidatus Dormibacteraeota bacterium]|nr:hypothetical protein [Candidatus Dormibacteraeota bacterium]
MSSVALALLVLLGLVTAASLALLGLVVRISLRRSRGASASGEAVNRAVRDAAAELIAELSAPSSPDDVEIAARRLAGLLDLDPATVRRAARSRNR